MKYAKLDITYDNNLPITLFPIATGAEYQIENRKVGIIAEGLRYDLIANLTRVNDAKMFSYTKNYTSALFEGNYFNWYSNGERKYSQIDHVESVIGVPGIFIYPLNYPTSGPLTMSVYMDSSGKLYGAMTAYRYAHITSSNSIVFSETKLDNGTEYYEYPDNDIESVTGYLGEYILAIPFSDTIDTIDTNGITYNIEPKSTELEYNTGVNTINISSFRYSYTYGDTTIDGGCGISEFTPEDNSISINWFARTINIDTSTVQYPKYTSILSIPTLNVSETFTLTILNNPNEKNPNPYNPGGNSSAGGGGGSYNTGSFGSPETSDPVGNDVPLGSTEGDFSSAGFITKYLCNSMTLETFGDWLWTDDLGLLVAKAGISLLYGDPAQSVISLMSYPFNLLSLQGLTKRNQNIYWGNFNSGVSSVAISSQAAYIDWGTIDLDEYWGNFLDYSPHTKIELYLPWSTGFVSIDPGQVLPGSIQVITNIDLNKGSCIHNVIGKTRNASITSTDNILIGTYAGQCGKQIPVLSSDNASKMAGLVTAAVAAAVIPVGGAVGGAADAIGMARGTKGMTQYAMTPSGSYTRIGNRAERIMDAASEGVSRGLTQSARIAGRLATTSLAINKHPISISRNGGFTDGSSSLSVQYPYIILSRPTQSVPNEYGHHYGYPSNIYSKLSELTGYTEIGEIHLDGIPATFEELQELENILKGGIIL